MTSTPLARPGLAHPAPLQRPHGRPARTALRQAPVFVGLVDTRSSSAPTWRTPGTVR